MPKRQSQSSTTKQKSNKKAKKTKVMGASGQTDAERRRLRAKQRNLQRQIISERGDAMEDPKSGVFEEVHDENNKMWNEVRFAREAVIDGENLELISARAIKQVNTLLEVPRYDANKLIEKLRAKCSNRNRTFNWNSLGKAAGACFNSVPSHVITFLNGPIDADFIPKVRKKRAPRQRIEEEEEEEENVEENTKQPSSTSDKLSTMEKHMVTLTHTLSRRCRNELENKVDLIKDKLDSMDVDEKNKTIRRLEMKSDICAVRYLFNPKSFTQTVENIFNFSFLIKKGNAKITVRSDDNDDNEAYPFPRPTVTVMKPQNNIPAKQAIVAFNMQDWRDMCKAFKVEKGDIPHRIGSKANRTK